MHRGRRALVASVVTLFACSCTSARSSQHQQQKQQQSPPQSPPPSVAPRRPPPSGPPAVPGQEVYLGAWVNPEGVTADRSASAVEQASVFEQQTGSSLAIVSVYTSFSAPAPLSVLERITQRGAIPLVSWGCSSTAAVASGRYDPLISRYAADLRDFGRPVLLRWFWEMDLATAASIRCDGGGGAATFITAWRHVRDLFRRTGAINVAFVWCPGVTSDVTRMDSYFPGAAYVDWIGADGYDYRHLGTGGFSAVFSGWYDAFRGYGKPMIIAETGAMAADQVEYLAGIRAVLPIEFPLISALVYFDARGPNGSWVLTPDGIGAFAALGRDPYFAARG